MSKIPMDAQAELHACESGQTCLKDLITTTDMLPIGVCGKSAMRGEACDFNGGIVCADAMDACAPSDPMRLDSEARCYQDCTTPMTMCDAGTCTEAKDMMGMVLGSYCLTP